MYHDHDYLAVSALPHCCRCSPAKSVLVSKKAEATVLCELGLTLDDLAMR